MKPKKILIEIVSVIFPATLATILQFIQETVNLIFIGNLNDPAKLAAVGMGNIFLNMFAVGQYTGLNSSLEVLVSQAFGSGKLDLCGIYLQRGRQMVFLYFVPLFIVLALSGKILRLFDQDESVTA